MLDMGNSYKNLVWKSERNRALGWRFWQGCIIL